VLVEGTGKDPTSVRAWPCAKEYFTLVAIDTHSHAVAVRPLRLTSIEDESLQRAAGDRRAHRLARREQSREALFRFCEKELQGLVAHAAGRGDRVVAPAQTGGLADLFDREFALDF
jgi:hypothetical protein